MDIAAEANCNGSSSTDHVVSLAAYRGSALAGKHVKGGFEAALERISHALIPCNARIYLAVSHTYRGDDRARISALAGIAQRCGTPLVATGDVLYHAPHRRPLQDVMTCMREGCTIDTAGYRLMPNAERHLKSPRRDGAAVSRLRGRLGADSRDREACRFSLDELRLRIPRRARAAGQDPAAASGGADLGRALPAISPRGCPRKSREAIEKELALIDELEFAPVLPDRPRHRRLCARRAASSARGAARRRTPSSAIASSITAVEPDRGRPAVRALHLAEARSEPPDIDVDFEHERREEVIQYIYARYGRDRAGLTATVISYRARSARARRRQGVRAFGRYGRGARRHGVGHAVGRRATGKAHPRGGPRSRRSDARCASSNFRRS